MWKGVVVEVGEGVENPSREGGLAVPYEGEEEFGEVWWREEGAEVGDEGKRDEGAEEESSIGWGSCGEPRLAEGLEVRGEGGDKGLADGGHGRAEGNVGGGVAGVDRVAVAAKEIVDVPGCGEAGDGLGSGHPLEGPDCERGRVGIPVEAESGVDS